MTPKNATARAVARDQEVDYTAFPPWLVSLICHAGIVLVLGLLIQAVPKDPGQLTLDFQADPGLTDVNAGGGGDPGLGEAAAPLVSDVDIDASIDPLAVDSAEIPLAESAADPLFNTKFDPLVTTPPESDAVAFDRDMLLTSAAATNRGPREGKARNGGDGGSGTGTGGGHGKGVGTGTGDGTGPGHATTSMFDIVGEGGDFVYVFDRSLSMSSVYSLNEDGIAAIRITPLEAVKKELVNSLEDLNESCRFQIVFYNGYTSLLGNTRRMYDATYENKVLAKSFVYTMPAEGDTHHLPALEEAIMCEPEIIFHLTDGEEKDDPSPEQIAVLMRECKQRKIKINVVHFGVEPRTTCSLIDLAEGTGGKYRFITLAELARKKLAAARGTPTLRAMESLPALE